MAKKTGRRSIHGEFERFFSLFFILLQDYCTSQLKFVPYNFIWHCLIFTMPQNTRYAFIVATENRCNKSFFQTANKRKVIRSNKW